MSAALDIARFEDDVQDQAVLSAPLAFKAVPAEEHASERVVYLEASSEDEDLQGETILRSALWASRAYFVKRGNLDIDHLSVLGRKLGVRRYWEYEIGRPTDVRKDGKIWVRGYLYEGCEHADSVWRSFHYKPPQVWFASVSGAILARDSLDQTKITEVRWNNLALTREPVNHKLRSSVSTRPIGPFGKGHLTLVGREEFAKALTAGYGSDAGALTGGAALRRESLAGASSRTRYREFRRLASRRVLSRQMAKTFTRGDLRTWALDCGYDDESAAMVADQFFKDLVSDLKNRRER
jgi:hypothetical protein